MAVVADVLALGSEFERSYAVIVHGRLKFRVGQLVYVGFSLDERSALVGGDPVKFQLPSESDMRFHWVHAALAALERPGIGKASVSGYGIKFKALRTSTSRCSRRRSAPESRRRASGIQG